MAFPAGDLSQGVVRQLALVSTEHQSEAFKVLASERLRVNIADLGLGVDPDHSYVLRQHGSKPMHLDVIELASRSLTSRLQIGEYLA